MIESFFFSFAITLNSQQTVMPAYISELSDDPFFISLISLISYGFTYFTRIFSVLIGMNTTSPKRATLLMCGLHRVGFLFLFVSTFFAQNNSTVAIIVVFVAFSVCCMLSGASSPVFNMLVANTVQQKIGSFFGSYSLVGAAAGIIASQTLTVCYNRFGFPFNYRVIFLICTLSAVLASIVLGIGIKETVICRLQKHVGMGDLSCIFYQTWKKNSGYRQYVIVRMIIAAAEMTMPFFIVRVGTYQKMPAGYIGLISMILLVSKMITSKLAGWLSDKKGTMWMLVVSCVAGIIANVMVCTANDYAWVFPVFFLVSFAQNGVYLSESIVNITYSDGRDTTVYSALSGVMITPVSVAAALVGGAIAEKYFLEMVFGVSAVLYLMAVMTTIHMKRKNLEDKNEGQCT